MTGGTSAGTTTTSAAETTAPAATEAPQAPTKAVKKGYDSSFEAAKAYYNAYLTGNADAVYDMLCEEEIEAYHSYLRSTDLLEGKNPQVVFKRSNVINAIKQSIQAIHDIMKEKSDVAPDKWTVSLTEDLLRTTGDNELADYRAATVGFVFQFYNLIPTLTVYENVQLVSQIAPDALDAKKMIGEVGLTDHLLPSRSWRVRLTTRAATASG